MSSGIKTVAQAGRPARHGGRRSGPSGPSRPPRRCWKPIVPLDIRRAIWGAESVEGAAADEQHVPRVELDERLLGVLPPALRWHTRDSALEHLQQRLLDALAAHVARDGGVVPLARELVDLVDVDDAALGPLDIVVGRLKQVAPGSTRHPRRRSPLPLAPWRPRSRKGTSRMRASVRASSVLPVPLGPEQEDVRLLELDVVEGVEVLLGLDALVVIVDRDRQGSLGAVPARSRARRANSLISRGVIRRGRPPDDRRAVPPLEAGGT